MTTEIPSKIVLVGTSSMSLNQRFSKIKKPVVRKAPLQQTVRVSGLNAASPRGAAPRARPIPTRNTYRPHQSMYEDEEGYEYDDELAGGYVEEYVQPAYSRRLPIDQRLSFPAQKVVYVPMRNQHRFGGRMGGGLGGGIYKRGRQQFGIPRNNFHNNGFNNGFRNFGGQQGGFRRFGGSGYAGGGFGRGRGFHNRNNNRQFQQQPKKTTEDLDRELDEYMKKSKHQPIQA